MHTLRQLVRGQAGDRAGPCRDRSSSAGAGAGEIVSKTLEGTLGVEQLGASAGQDKIGLDLFTVGNAGPLLAFSCGATTASLRGSVIVPVKANKMSPSATLKFKASKGRQKPEGFAGEAKDVLEASFDEGPFEELGLSTTTTQTSEEPVEVNAAV
jgi:hypothetical protein